MGRMDPQQLWLTPDRPRRGRRPAFSREAVTAAAVELADAEGLDAVTMRRVAAQVGAGVMSLYSYAPDKETLVDLMVDRVNGELPVTGALSGDWRTDLKTVAHHQRALMLRHPWLPAALSTHRSLGPHALAFLEHALAALRPTGLDGAAKLEVFSLLTGFVASHVSHELTRATTAQSPDRAAAEARYSPPSPPTATTRSSPGPSPPRPPLTPEATFTRFLDRLVDGLDTAPEAPTGRHRPEPPPRRNGIRRGGVHGGPAGGPGVRPTPGYGTRSVNGPVPSADWTGSSRRSPPAVRRRATRQVPGGPLRRRARAR
ncbi:TetR/AcrR family transcriptional regulator [Streptomyces albulus]|nr:TetR/AcrR family transcriptional regulator [Streptomyces noursei]